MSEPRTDAIARGSSRDTPKATDVKVRGDEPSTQRRVRKGFSSPGQVAQDWLTPKASDGRAKGTTAGDLLTNQVRAEWPTPRASENEQRTAKHQPSTERGHGKTLAASVLTERPTPSATPYGTSNNGNPHDSRTEYATKGKPSLERMATEWPTATATDANASGQRHAAKAHPGTSLTDAINGDFGRQAQASRSTSGSRRARLNPRWVAALMGFPIDWFD